MTYQCPEHVELELQSVPNATGFYPITYTDTSLGGLNNYYLIMPAGGFIHGVKWSLKSLGIDDDLPPSLPDPSYLVLLAAINPTPDALGNYVIGPTTQVILKVVTANQSTNIANPQWKYLLSKQNNGVVIFPENYGFIFHKNDRLVILAGYGPLTPPPHLNITKPPYTVAFNFIVEYNFPQVS